MDLSKVKNKAQCFHEILVNYKNMIRFASTSVKMTIDDESDI